MNQQGNNKHALKMKRVNPPLPKISLFIWIICIGLLVLLLWAWLFKLEEVSTGMGKVIPSSKEQTIQSLEGGILTKLNVHEGQVVEQGEVLAQLDQTRQESNVGESTSVLLAAKATAARLHAEVNGSTLSFPEDVLREPALVKAEIALYDSRRANLEESLTGLKQALTLVEQELNMTEPLVDKGAASDVEVLRLKRQATDIRNKMSDIRNQYLVHSREELAKANTEIEKQSQVVKGRTDTLSRTIFKSPVRGIVKEIEVMTLGGVISQNGKLMTIVPLDEQLLVETRISPRDIAFIHPDQDALVKFTAYDYAIYGGLEGKVMVISPNTLRDEVKQDQYYYRVYIQTDSDQLVSKAGQKFSITPGMVATVDIHTGEKSVLDYLIKPFNKTKEALRER
ncbi:HlyD family efflux transporter periplasmic adaptor subunit [Acinetobacter haemolyticus]|uniref:HlyD family efflux transporter periplasmic adaptor subunit n=1 Tax=Acinetobacter haemolyticus TaxID=29430 RepID=UPI0024DE1CD2|nr:HlyD family efflux transporter periplasmic adaptor subunit [Acinetobacter haemolyticus]